MCHPRAGSAGDSVRNRCQLAASSRIKSGFQDSPKRPAFSPTTPDLVFITAKISLVQPHRDRRSLSLVQAKQDFPTLQLREQQGVAFGRQGSPNFRNGLWGGADIRSRWTKPRNQFSL